MIGGGTDIHGLDHHGAGILHADVTSEDASEHVSRSYDPHHFLLHLAHRDQIRAQGLRAPVDHGFYERIADAVALGGKIIVVGHGTGKSNVAQDLTTTPFDMVVLNNLGRCQLALDAIRRIPRLSDQVEKATARYWTNMERHKLYISEDGDDMPDFSG